MMEESISHAHSRYDSSCLDMFSHLLFLSDVQSQNRVSGFQLSRPIQSYLTNRTSVLVLLSILELIPFSMIQNLKLPYSQVFSQLARASGIPLCVKEIVCGGLLLIRASEQYQQGELEQATTLCASCRETYSEFSFLNYFRSFSILGQTVLHRLDNLPHFLGPAFYVSRKLVLHLVPRGFVVSKMLCLCF